MKFTKHFYIEGQRIVSLPAETLVKAGKLGDMGKNQELLNPKDTARAGNNGNHPIDWDNKHEHLKDQLIENFEELGLTGAVFYSPNNYFNGVRELASLGSAGKSGKIPYGQIKKYYRNSNGIIDGYGSDSTITRNYDGNKAELLQFYYHPDHLGSSNYITDVSGEVYQHMEYFPFGETFIEERNGTDYTNYLYNGKEFDEEIGLYYYGARYYDPKMSMFYGVDPITEEFPHLSPYNYASNNSITNVDLWGLQGIHFQKALKLNKDFNLGYKAQRSTKVGKVFSKKLVSQTKYDVFYFSLKGSVEGKKVTIEKFDDFINMHKDTDIRRSIDENELKEIMKEGKSAILIGVNEVAHDGVGNEDANNTGKILNHEEFHGIDVLNDNKYSGDEEHTIYTGEKAYNGLTPENKAGSLGAKEAEKIDKYIEQNGSK